MRLERRGVREGDAPSGGNPDAHPVVRIVLDTNIVIAAFLSPLGAPAQVVDLVLAGEIVLLLDDRVLDEYREVARRPKFGFSRDDVDRVLDVIATYAERVIAPPLSVKLPDASDLPFLEVAVAGAAEALVTGNVRHFTPRSGRHHMRIVTARQFLDVLRQAR